MWDDTKLPTVTLQAAAGFLGIKPTARKEHMVRAMLESLAYRVVQLLRAVDEETSCTYTKIRLQSNGRRARGAQWARNECRR